MRAQFRAAAVAAACSLLPPAAAAFALAQTRPPAAVKAPKDSAMTKHARGEFEVKTSPQPPDDKAAGSVVGRFLLDKQFRGGLEGASRGQMLGVRTGVEGSAGYVAMEQVEGTLDGRRGTFVLQHSGTMERGALRASVTVVPDSGTGELAGLAGRMEIKAEGGKHSYDFEYTLGEAR